jgi:hypothetical protein
MPSSVTRKCPNCGKEIEVSIEGDRAALLQLYQQFQTLRQYETSKLRESGTFFEVIITALILGSFGFGINYNPLGAALSVFAVTFAIVGTLDIRRCYLHFLRWTSVSCKIEEHLQLHNPEVDILPEELKEVSDLESKKKELEKSDSGFYWIQYLFGKVWKEEKLKDTLFQTYIRVFALFLYASIVIFWFNIFYLVRAAFI